MALLYWNNLCNGNKSQWPRKQKIGVYASNTLVFGHVAKVVLQLENAKRFRSGTSLGKSGSKTKILQEYIKTANIKTRVEFNTLGLFQDEEVLKQFFVDFPEMIQHIVKVVVPSCDEASSLLKEGCILIPDHTTFTKRATIKSGSYKQEVIDRVIALHSNSDGKLWVSPVFEYRTKNKLRYNGMPYLSAGYIFTNDEKYFTLLSLLDEKLVHKIHNVKTDPGIVPKQKKQKKRK